MHRRRTEYVRGVIPNAQHEPPFLGAQTVVWCLRYPDYVTHLPTKRCHIQRPHLIAECGEFETTNDDA